MERLGTLEEKLLEEINDYRQQIEKAYEQEKSFTHPRVYELSIKLDLVLNQYNRLKKEKNR